MPGRPGRRPELDARPRAASVPDLRHLCGRDRARRGGGRLPPAAAVCRGEPNTRRDECRSCVPVRLLRGCGPGRWLQCCCEGLAPHCHCWCVRARGRVPCRHRRERDRRGRCPGHRRRGPAAGPGCGGDAGRHRGRGRHRPAASRSSWSPTAASPAGARPGWSATCAEGRARRSAAVVRRASGSTIDSTHGLRQLDVPDAEIAARLAAHTPPPPRVTTGVRRPLQPPGRLAADGATSPASRSAPRAARPAPTRGRRGARLARNGLRRASVPRSCTTLAFVRLPSSKKPLRDWASVSVAWATPSDISLSAVELRLVAVSHAWW